MGGDRHQSRRGGISVFSGKDALQPIRGGRHYIVPPGAGVGEDRGPEHGSKEVLGQVCHLPEDLRPARLKGQPQGAWILHNWVHQQFGKHVGLHQELPLASSNQD